MQAAEAGASQRVPITDNVTLDFSGLFTPEEAPRKTAQPLDEAPPSTPPKRDEIPLPESPPDIKPIYRSPQPPPKPATPPPPTTSGLKDNALLQRQADANKAELEQARAVYKHYQSNIMKSSQLQNEILKGLKLGQDVYTLFLKAVEAVSLMTSDTTFYKIAKEDLIAIYGRGLRDPQPLQIELDEIQERIRQLKEAETTEDSYTRERLHGAIPFLESRAAELTKLLARAKSKAE